MDKIKFFAFLLNALFYVGIIGISHWFFLYTIWAYIIAQMVVFFFVYEFSQRYFNMKYYMFSIWAFSNLVTFVGMYFLTK